MGQIARSPAACCGELHLRCAWSIHAGTQATKRCSILWQRENRRSAMSCSPSAQLLTDGPTCPVCRQRDGGQHAATRFLNAYLPKIRHLYDEAALLIGTS